MSILSISLYVTIFHSMKIGHIYMYRTPAVRCVLLSVSKDVYKKYLSIVIFIQSFIMKIHVLFYIAFLTISFVESKINRLGKYRKYHQNRINNGQRRNFQKTVRNKICNAQTCTKCLNAFANLAGVSRNMQVACVTILKLRSCCPRRLLKQF